MKAKLEIAAEKENLKNVIQFLNEQLDKEGCSMKAQMQLEMAVEELFINIASYAYAPGKGSAAIECTFENGAAEITFTDEGIPYDPLARADPDTTLSAEKRQIGGLGILMVKKTMDSVAYKHENGCNILTIKKQIK